jgi:hypothetical protein
MGKSLGNRPIASLAKDFHNSDTSHVFIGAGEAQIGNLNVSGTITTDIFTANINTLESDRLYVSNSATINGNLDVLGNLTYLNTEVQISDQVIITNYGQGEALFVNQVGQEDILHIQDDGATVLKIYDGGSIGVHSDPTQAPINTFYVQGNLQTTEYIIVPKLNADNAYLKATVGNTVLVDQSVTAPTINADDAYLKRTVVEVFRK